MYTQTKTQGQNPTFAKYETLQKYHTYLIKQMDCLRLETQKDDAQLDLLQLNICQSIMALSEKRNTMVKDLQRLEGQQISQKQYSLEIQAENVQRILQIKEQYRLQQDLRRQQRNLRDTAHCLMKEIQVLKQVMDPNNMEDGIYGKMAEHDMKLLEQKNKEKEEMEYRKKMWEKESTKIEQIKRRQQKMGEIREQIQRLSILKEQKDNECEMNRKQLQKMKDENKIKMMVVGQLKGRISEIKQKKNVNCELQKEMDKHKNKLGHELKVALKDLQSEERGRQQDEQKMKKQILQREQNINYLQSLHNYLEQLHTANSKYYHILQQQHTQNINIGNVLRLNGNITQQMNKRPQSPSQSQKNKYPFQQSSHPSQNSKDTCKKSASKQNQIQSNRFKRSMTSSTWNTGFFTHNHNINRLKIN